MNIKTKESLQDCYLMENYDPELDYPNFDYTDVLINYPDTILQTRSDYPEMQEYDIRTRMDEIYPKIYPGLQIPSKVRRHARLTDNDGILYVSNKPPHRLGEYSCYVTPCPTIYEDDIVCWKCMEITAQPELE